MDSAVAKDKRFAQIAKDPRFHRMKRKDRKVTIDKRFHGMFEDKRFKLKYTVDKRGRPVRTTTNDHLQKYYDLSDEENEEDSAESDEDEKVTKKKDKKKSKKKEDESDESGSDVEEDEVSGKSKTILTAETGKVKQKTNGKEESSEEESEDEESSDDAEAGTDLTRGVGNEETSSSSDESEEDDDGKDLARGEGNVETSSDESDEESEEEEAFDHKWGELHYTAPAAEEITARMAVCNMDWDRMKANDIFVLLNSFKPTGGVIKSVAIYPSEFGKERMAEEDVKGPKELVERGPQDDEVEEGSDLQREKMRQYQLNRLRYYYAVVECDTPETANAIYEECDGIEYESTATRMDLRFIPNDMTFDDSPKTVATSMPDSSTYKPSQFITTALQQSKVDLTWDETDRDRTAVTMRKFTKEDLEDLDMKDYLASSESEGEDPYADFLEQPDFGQPEKDESDEVVLNQYKDILKTTKDKGKKEKKSDVGLEISWDPSLMEEAEKKVLKKSSGNETPWEKYLVKKKEKKKKERKKKKSDKDSDKIVEAEETGEHNKKKSKKLKKTKDIETVEESESHNEDQEEGHAFSDDDLPSDLDMEDDFFKDEMNQQKPAGPSDKKKTKKKGKPKDDEEKKKKMAELALLMEDNEEDRNHFNLKDIIEKEGSNLSKTKRKKLKKLKKKQEEQGLKVSEDTFKVDVSDPRFEDIFKNPLYNIDPSASEFKATRATDALIQEKLRRRQQESKLGAVKAKKRQSEGAAEGISATKQSKNSNAEDDPHGPNTKDHSLATLVKSVKAKTQTLKDKKRR